METERENLRDKGLETVYNAAYIYCVTTLALASSAIVTQLPFNPINNEVPTYLDAAMTFCSVIYLGYLLKDLSYRLSDQIFGGSKIPLEAKLQAETQPKKD